MGSSIFLHNNLHRIRFRQQRNHLYQQYYCNHSKKHILTIDEVVCNKSLIASHSQLNHHKRFKINTYNDNQHRSRHSTATEISTENQPTKSNNDPTSSKLFMPRIFVTNMLDTIWYSTPKSSHIYKYSQFLIVEILKILITLI